jgi:uncharacterized protein (TIGR03792 family)
LILPFIVEDASPQPFGEGNHQVAVGEAGDGTEAGAGTADDGGAFAGDREGVVVEELSFEVEAELLDRWVAREAEAWDAFLAAQDGYLGKEVWIAAESPGRTLRTVRTVIWWASRAQWKAVDSGAVAAGDERMGPLLRHAECREFRWVRRA